ncbi:hypothetical protein [Ureibacillus sinduriensis]|uniref:DUF2157 domain-containing protein n=1 Tax=Ureibacillus sinduriensis BLB-1 = JCM 15800 TaxID=1384057 RepID=A0A0A3HTJ7_9BACL|nr:hypothetical protein [Ureibacillus sinduriensis]KGR74545.1 hypothetical protein CD33_15730 [Ureibacillus sinduriensis BLB-1 = JCM 15800]
MANAKKKIILNEILFWKQNKLLPDHYCDFLMTLYTEGNETELEAEIDSKNSVIAQAKRLKFILLTITIIVTAAILFVLFMASTLTWLAAIVGGIFALILMISAYRFAKKKEMLSPILHIASALILFGISVKVCIEYFPGSQVVLYSLLVSNCLLWLFTGFKFKLIYFTVSGVLGLIVLVGYQVFSLQ